MLIDDSYARILPKIAALDGHVSHVLRTALTLAALRAKEVPAEVYDMRVLPLESWYHIDDFIKEVTTMVSCVRDGEPPKLPDTPPPEGPEPTIPDTPPLPTS